MFGFKQKKKKVKDTLLLLATLMLLVVFIGGLLYTESDTFAKKRNPAQHNSAVQVVQQVEDSSSQPNEVTQSSEETPISSQEIEWVQQETPVQLPILMYHAIHVMGPGEEGSANLIVDPATFESHLQALKNAGYYAVSPEEAYRMLTENVVPKDRKAVWLTFDDSIWDFYDIAYPLLKQYQMKATNNVITATVGGEANLSLEEMLEMKENGISLQGHTVNHPTLGETDYATQEMELTESKSYLDNNLNQDTISLAYPSGSYNSDTLYLAELHNYKLGVTTNEGLASAENGLLSLNRVRILPTTTAEMLLQVIATP